MFSRPWLSLLRRHVLIHRRALAFCLTVAAVLLAWTAFIARPPALVPSSAPSATVMTSPPRPGFVDMPVRFADGEMAALLHQGQRIQIWASDPRSQRSRLVAPDVGVIDVPGLSGNGVMAGRTSRLVVVEVRSTDVAKVTLSGANGVLTYTLDQ